MAKNIDLALDTIAANFLQLKTLSPVIAKIADVWKEALLRGNKIMFCGNGGSAADSQHLAAELTGRYMMERPPLAGLSLTTDTSSLTATGNDYGFEFVFSRPLKALGKAKDVLVGISTSGNSQNVIEAFLTAREMDIKTVAFTGQNGGKLKDMADICLCVPSQKTNNIQEMHIACGHIICGIVEKEIFPKNES